MSKLTLPERAAMRRLQLWAEKYMGLINEMNAHCAELSDEELAALSDDTRVPNQTNCWWATYQVAPMLRSAIADETHMRTLRRLRADQAEETR